MKKIFVLLSTIVILAACGSAYDDLIEDANKAFDDGKYDSAEKLYKVALEENEDGDGDEAKDKLAILEDYDELKVLFDDEDIKNAQSLIDDLLDQKYVDGKIKKDIQEYQKELDTYVDTEEELLADLEKIEDLIHKDKLDSATKYFDSFDNTINSSEVLKKYNVVADILAEATEAKEAEEKEKKEEEKKKDSEKKSNNDSSSKSKYDKYMDAVDDLDDKMYADAEESGLQDMTNAHLFFDEWDKLLNDVWKDIKKSLSKSDYNALLDEQREWIKQKDQQYENDKKEDSESAKNNRAIKTRERTIYLIENYIQ